MISVLVEVHDYIERQKDNTMGLFNDLEEDVEEITISPELIDEEIIEPTGFDEIIRNATAAYNNLYTKVTNKYLDLFYVNFVI